MNISSEPLAFPINHHYRVPTGNHSPMLLSASPIAVNNKIRAIQTRKPRVTLQSYYDYTDVRPLNIGNTAGVTNSSGNFSNLSPEKLVERSKDLRLGRISTRPNPRSSVLSTTSTTNQPSLIWPSYNSPTGITKQLQSNSPTAFGSTMNKSSATNMPDIHQRTSRARTVTRQPLTEQQNSSIPVEARHKSLPKYKSSMPKAYHRTIAKSKSPFPVSHSQPLQISQNDHSKQSKNNNNNHHIHLYESEEDDENLLVMDDEFEEYLQKAIVKCADWLMTYVFDKKYDENDE